MNTVSRAQRVVDLEIAALRKLRGRLSEPSARRQFERAVEMMEACLKRRGKIVVTGIGKSGLIGQKVAATLTSTGATSVVLNSVDALHGDLGVLADGDVVLAFSYGGETEELLNSLPAIKRFNVQIVAITGSPKSRLAHYCDIVLNVAVDKEACPLNLAPTASTTSMLVMGDALAMVLLEARGFKKRDFARLHPGGAIGRSLLFQVKDIMRTGDRNAVIASGRTVKEAIMAMTRAKSGSISIVDGRGKLVGIFTDGDFRRHIERDEHVMRRKLREVMTPHPIVVYEDQLAVEAVKVFNEREIDDLVVVDRQHRPVGLVDSQDLP
ncbi:MAG: KpsF/GutQ family sugar-phosphate isomerase, partial [Verrucomicrobia bacterium]|nr:KpsF/GutQ family sugar-phosphate isomerase [Verrucomicrobiota bacterium]